MTRLDTEHQRLYRPPADANLPADGDGVRAAALVLSDPADWSQLSLLWRGVQADLDWPAPAIAVSGHKGYQLWFSFASALPREHAHALLAALHARYLPEVAPRRIAVLPARAGDALPLPPLLTCHTVGDERWSAFVAPDLAPVFADTPWLDTPPNPEGQADLLSRLRSITADELLTARTALGLDGPAAARNAGTSAAASTHTETLQPSTQAPVYPAEAGSDPRAFLQAVMNDPSVALALRIEAAKALL